MSIGTKAGALGLLLMIAGVVVVTLGLELPGAILVFAGLFVLVARIFMPGGFTSSGDPFDLAD